jgi:hypothetical protein
MEQYNSNNNTSAQNLGIAALITGIITFVLAVIPCVGLIAIIPGIVALILASVGLSQASRSNSPKGVLLAALIITVLACMISISQVFVATKIAQKATKWPNEIQNIINDVQDNVIKDLEDNNVSIKVTSDGDSVEIKASTRSNSREKELEDLEGVKSNKNDSVPKKK